MSQQNRPIIPSLITLLYASWEQYSIPAIFYHYTLAILSKKERKEQIGIMHREINQLKTGNHMYHQISDTLEARQRSLEIIKRNVHVLMQNQSAVSLNWENAEFQVESEGYDLVFQSRTAQKKDNGTLVELINHLRMYQKVTYQVIISIHSWEKDLLNEGYVGAIQFLYKHEDYLQKIPRDTKEIIENYSNLFENNVFLTLKKEHQFSQFAIVYQNLKISSDFASKIYQALQIIQNHEIAIQRHRIQGKYKQIGSRKKITKSQSLHKIYCNYNNNRDYLIIKDPQLRSDKLKLDPRNSFKFLNNRNILFNPEMTPPRLIEKRHPVYIKSSVEGKSEEMPLTRSSSLNDVKIRKIKHKQSLVITPNIEVDQNLEKIMNKKLSLYESLDKTIKFQRSSKNDYFKSIETPKVKQQIQEQQPKLSTLQTPDKIIEEKPVQSQIKFIYQTGISATELFKYLRDQAFKGKQIGISDIELIAKKIISEKDYVTFIKVTSGEKTAAWMVIKFLTKDLSIRKAVEVIFTYKFFKIPNFEDLLIEQFVRNGYGIIKENGKIVHQTHISERIGHEAIKIKYKVSTNFDEHQLKSVIKNNECLKESRILKFYHYSKKSKYHTYCNHKDNCCQIGYEFEEVFKIKIAQSNYLRFRCDKITKTGNCYRIFHHLNSTELLIGNDIEDILEVSSQSSIEMNSSFEDQGEIKYEYFCLPEVKIMHKYLNLTEKPLIVEYLTVNGDIPEVLSISMDKKSSKNHLIIERPFTIGFICKKKEDCGKLLSVSTFN